VKCVSHLLHQGCDGLITHVGPGACQLQCNIELAYVCWYNGKLYVALELAGAWTNTSAEAVNALVQE
jgi:hypothetical protein